MGSCRVRLLSQSADRHPKSCNWTTSNLPLVTVGSRCVADGHLKKATILSARFFKTLNPVAVQLNRALGRVQGHDDIGRAGFNRDACESDGLVSRLQLDGRGMRDGNALQRHA